MCRNYVIVNRDVSPIHSDGSPIHWISKSIPRNVTLHEVLCFDLIRITLWKSLTRKLCMETALLGNRIFCLAYGKVPFCFTTSSTSWKVLILIFFQTLLPLNCKFPLCFNPTSRKVSIFIFLPPYSKVPLCFTTWKVSSLVPDCFKLLVCSLELPFPGQQNFILFSINQVYLHLQM